MAAATENGHIAVADENATPAPTTEAADGLVTVFHDPENFTVKHPLMHEWTLWFTKPPSGKVRAFLSGSISTADGLLGRQLERSAEGGGHIQFRGGVLGHLRAFSFLFLGGYVKIITDRLITPEQYHSHL
jgi:hypothetical protein